MNDALSWSLRYLSAGLSVIPIRPDGSKAPASDQWKRYQSAPPAEAEVRAWHAAPGPGVAVVGGPASGELCVLDIEYADYHGLWSALVGGVAPGLAERLPAVRTPGHDEEGGRHLYFRTPGPARSAKLAVLGRDEAARRAGDPGKRTAIETKAAGGYVLAPGCPPACHPSGRTYEWLPGPQVEDIPCLSDDEVRVVLAAAEVLTAPGDGAVAACDRAQPGPRPDGSLPPGADYNLRGGWDDLLRRHGWTPAHARGDVGLWRRPGKSGGVSATTGFCRTERSGGMLYVFSTNAHPFEAGRAYSLFAALALLEHGGDFSAAASALGKAGFGDPPLGRKALAVLSASGAAEEAAPAPADGGEVPPDGPPANGGVPPWPEGVFPPAVEAYVTAVARAKSCPPDFPAASVLAAVSVAVGSVRLAEVRRSWKEYGRLFLAVVAHPGTGKSPAQDEVLAPLMDRQLALDEEFRLELAAYEAALAEAEAPRRGRGRRGGEGAAPLPCRPRYQNLFTTNATTEALAPMLADNPRGLLVIKDELVGWVRGMDQYKGGKGDDRANWLSAWSGAPIKVDRKGDRDRGPVVVPRPFVSLVGNITPDNLCSLAEPQGRSDGMLDRFLFVVPPRAPFPERIGEDPDPAAEAAWRACLSELWAMRFDYEGGRCAAVAVPLSPSGREASDGWFAAHARRMNAPDFPPRLIGPWSKLRSYYFRLALLIHCLREACGEDVSAGIDADTALRAAMLIDYFAAHTRAAYASMSRTEEDDLAERAMSWALAHGGRASPRDLVRARIVGRATEAEALLAGMADRQWGTLERPVRKGPGRPPSVVFVAERPGGAATPDEACAQIFRPEEGGEAS